MPAFETFSFGAIARVRATLARSRANSNREPEPTNFLGRGLGKFVRRSLLLLLLVLWSRPCLNHAIDFPP